MCKIWVSFSSLYTIVTLNLNPLSSSKYTIARSVAYGGASARLLRVLSNARQGKPTKIGILGGSVSKGHGIKAEQNWIVLFESWWKTVRYRLQLYAISFL